MIKSPCTRHCGLNVDNICVGCGRTVRELRIWSSCSDEEKQEIVSKSCDRLRSMQELRDEGFLHDDEN
jgi:predicted Fe-S protein YdhL (DUF1289 family)